MVSESSFSHGVMLDALDDAGKLITIENLDCFTVIYERKKGNYHQLPQEWCRFIEDYGVRAFSLEGDYGGCKYSQG